MSGSSSTCKRCGKSFSGPQCPFCTVTGVDLEALLNAEEMMLRSESGQASPVSLVDMVSGKTFAVPTPICKIGRDLANNISLAGDRSMSRFHFQIRQSGAEYYIEDCGSRNGTFLNGSPIAVARKLQNGDIVSAGVSRYRFTILSEADLRTTVPPQNSDTEDNNPASLESEESQVEAKVKEINELREAMQKLRGAVDDESSPLVSGPNAQIDDSDLLSPLSDFGSFPPVKDESQTELSKPETIVSEFKADEAPPLKAVSQPQTDPVGAPEWLEEYVFPELQKLMTERERLNGLLEEVRQDIKQIDRKIAASQGISQALLSSGGPELGQAVKQVFDALDWLSEHAAKDPFDLSLKREPKVEAVVRISVCSQEEPNNKEFEALVNQQAVVWCQYNYEPKGIMVVQVNPALPPRQRPALSKDFLENMRRKKVCVILPTQLLAIYRFVVLGGQDKNYFKEMILNTCGPLQGFVMKPQENRAATA